jgi:hypothetical protein
MRVFVGYQEQPGAYVYKKVLFIDFETNIDAFKRVDLYGTILLFPVTNFASQAWSMLVDQHPGIFDKRFKDAGIQMKDQDEQDATMHRVGHALHRAFEQHPEFRAHLTAKRWPHFERFHFWADHHNRASRLANLALVFVYIQADQDRAFAAAVYQKGHELQLKRYSYHGHDPDLVQLSLLDQGIVVDFLMLAAQLFMTMPYVYDLPKSEKDRQKALARQMHQRTLVKHMYPNADNIVEALEATWQTDIAQQRKAIKAFRLVMRAWNGYG